MLGGVFYDGGTAADGVVGGAGFGGAAFGDCEGDGLLEGGEEGGEADYVGVGEEVVQEACESSER